MMAEWGNRLLLRGLLLTAKLVQGADLVEVNAHSVGPEVGIGFESSSSGIPPGGEEGVGENDLCHITARRVIKHVPVNEEEHGQVDLFTRQKALLLEAETFHLGEIRCHLRTDGSVEGWRTRDRQTYAVRCYVVRSNTNNVLFRVVLGSEESKSCFAWENVKLLGAGCEGPG